MNTIKRLKAVVASWIGVGAIMDDILEFSDAQSIALGGPVGGTQTHADSTNIINFGDAYVGKTVGKGTPVYLNVQVNTAFAGTAASVLDIYLNSSADGTTWASGPKLGVITQANAATIGVTILRQAFPASEYGLNKYLCLVYSGTGMTSGAVDAWLSLEAPTQPLDTKTPGWTA